MKVFFTIAILIAPAFATAQSGDLFGQLVRAEGGAVNSLTEKKYTGLVRHLEEKQVSSNSERLFLEYLFAKVQRQFLRTYQSQVAFSDLFSTGRYDCLSATSLYASLLTELDIPFRIVETNYHIVLIASTAEGEIMLEATDRFNGFVRGANDIEQRLLLYQSQSPQADGNTVSFQLPGTLLREVNPNQLINLFQYNRAVAAFNHKDWVGCAVALEKASMGYHSPRISSLGALLITAVAEDSSWTDEKRLKFVRQFYTVLLNRQQDVASTY